MTVEVFANVAESTLAVAALSTDTTGTLVAGAPFPAAGQYRLRLDDSLQQPGGIATRYELCRATFNAGNVVNLFRTGADLEGTTAQGWPIGTAVRAIVTAAGLTNAIATIPAQGTLPGGYAARTANQGPMAGTWTITGSTITVTVGAGRRIRVSGETLLGSTVSTDVIGMSIYEGATELARSQSPPAGSFAVSLLCAAVLTPTAGSHTYSLTVKVASGSGNLTVTAGAVAPTYILAEDIGV
jgi:hypothetical protein